jgi:hypothetical protein
MVPRLEELVAAAVVVVQQEVATSEREIMAGRMCVVALDG